MLFYLLLLSTNSLKYEFPEYAMLMTGSAQRVCQKWKDEIEPNMGEIRKQCKKSKEGDEIYEYCKVIYPFQGYYCPNSNEVNDELSRISKDTKLLLVTISDINSIKIDFNKLPNIADVALEYVNTNSYPYKKTSKYNIDNLIESYNKISGKKLSVKQYYQINKNTKDTSTNLELVGNIGNKVRSLTVISKSCTLKFTDGDVDVENLNLIGVELLSDTKNIKSKRLIVDGDAHTNIIDLKKDKLIEVDQYGISLADASTKELQIVLGNNDWTLKMKKDGKYVDYVESPYNKVQYNWAKSFNMLSESSLIDINVPDTSVTKPQDVNISSFEFGIQAPELSTKLLEEGEKRQLKVTKSGEWSQITTKPNIVVNYNKNDVEVDIDEGFKDAGIEVKQEEPFDYPKQEVKKKNVGLIVGVTIACVVVVVVIVVVVVVIVIRKKKNAQDKSISEGENANDNA